MKWNECRMLEKSWREETVRDQNFIKMPGYFQVFFSVLMGAMNVGQASPYVEAFSTAKAAAAAIFAVIDRKPPIDSLSVSSSGNPLIRLNFTDLIMNYPHSVVFSNSLNNG